MNTQRKTYLLLAHVLLVSALLGGLARAAAAASAIGGTVRSSLGLNLRAGPSLQHRVIVVLKDGQEVELVGRSQSGAWLEARLPESGLGGWVYAAFVEAAAEVSALPVTEASGGANDERPPAARNYSLYVTIVDNQATVYLQRFPAQAEVTIRLGRAGGAADLLAARGQTDADGQAQVTFPMPARWGDGKAVTERSLTLQAATADGSFSRSVTVLYIR